MCYNIFTIICFSTIRKEPNCCINLIDTNSVMCIIYILQKMLLVKLYSKRMNNNMCVKKIYIFDKPQKKLKFFAFVELQIFQIFIRTQYSLRNSQRNKEGLYNVWNKGFSNILKKISFWSLNIPLSKSPLFRKVQEPSL